MSKKIEYVVEFKCGVMWIMTERMESRVKAAAVEALFNRHYVATRVVVVKTEEYFGCLNQTCAATAVIRRVRARLLRRVTAWSES